MSEGRAIPFFGDGSTARDYTYVADIVEGIERALDWATAAPPGAFEIVNLGESQTTSLTQLVALISAALGIQPQLDIQPAQPGDVQRTFASVDKARSLFGYDPRTNMEEGIAKFVEWYRAQPKA